jgi:hypothetical protein
MSRNAGGHGCSAQGSTQKSSADGKTHLHLRVLGTAHACYWCVCAREHTRCCRPRALDGLDEQGNTDAHFTTKTCLPASDATTTIFLF